MVNPLVSPLSESQPDVFWLQLKQAIARSSGFQRWLLEGNMDGHELESASDNLVMTYLRQTLETLAY